MVGKFIFVLLCIAVLESASAAKCDCKCMLKHCKEGEKKYPADCAAIFQKCELCGTEDCNDEMLSCIGTAETKEAKRKCVDNFYKCGECMCRKQICEKHAKEHGKKDRCAVSLDICRKCNVKQCDLEMGKCWKTVKGHGDMHKCIEAWEKCGKCMCRYDACAAHSPTPEKCVIGLNLCKRCNTAKCDEDEASCMKLATSPAGKQSCITGWYTCVMASCH